MKRSLADYLALRDSRPADFDGPADGVRIATDQAEIVAIETEVGERYARKGWPRDWASAGLHYQDPFLQLVRDAVVFPDGYRAVHHRVLSNSHPSGAAVLPLHDGRLVLLRHFRHPSRQWHWEIPRGGIDPRESAEQTARTELREELSAKAETLTPLGFVHGSTALISGSVALFCATVTKPGTPPLQEGIAEVRLVKIGEAEAMIASSEITDSFTLAAFLRARLAGLI